MNRPLPRRRSIRLLPRSPGIYVPNEGAGVWKGHILDLTSRRDEASQAYKDALEVDIGGRNLRIDYDVTFDRKYVEERLKTPLEGK